MRRELVAAAALVCLAVAGCASEDEENSAASVAPEAVARQWAEALKRGDRDAACRITIPTKTPCRERLSKLLDPSTKFTGPASIGREPAKGDEVFSFYNDKGTIFVTVIGKQVEQRVRLELSVLR